MSEGLAGFSAVAGLDVCGVQGRGVCWLLSCRGDRVTLQIHACSSSCTSMLVLIDYSSTGLCYYII
jgi:hypothetical protein